MKKQLAALMIALGLLAAGKEIRAQGKTQDDKMSQDKMADKSKKKKKKTKKMDKMEDKKNKTGDKKSPS